MGQAQTVHRYACVQPTVMTSLNADMMASSEVSESLDRLTREFFEQEGYDAAGY